MLRQALSTTAVGLMLILAFAVAQTPAQAPTPQTESPTPAPEITFRVEVNYVEEDVRVVDQQGNFVKNLKQQDFQLLEDGKPQKVTTFGMVDIPRTPLRRPLFAAPDALPIDPDVADNDQVLDGRLYLILLDDYHVNALRSQRVRDLARRFVLEKLGANDQAAVVVTSGTVQGSQDFTQNRRLLLEAIDRFIGQKLQSTTLTRLQGRIGDPDQSATMNTDDMEAPERTYKARAALNTLRNISEWMAAIQGRRKAIVYISEGIEQNLYDMFSAGGAGAYKFDTFGIIQQETWDAISAASRSNVQIYSIDPRGLSNMGDEEILIGALPDNVPELGRRSLGQELQASEMNLRLLAEETGGVAAVGTNDMNAAFDRIVQENSSYYVLGYYPTNDKRDGRLRQVSVRVNGYPDAQVTYRKRYAAPSGRAPRNTTSGKPLDPAAGLTQELMKAMASPLPKAGLPLRVSAVPHKGLGKMTDLAVLVETSGKELTFSERGGTFNNTVSLSIGVYDKEGKPVAVERPDVKLTLRPETHARLLQGGLRMLRHLSVPPGRYQLRVAVQDSGKTRQGSTHLDIDAPDFTKAPIAMSGIAIASTADHSVTPPVEKDPFNGGLPAPPTTLREFPANEELTAFVEVYDNQPTPTHRIDITTTVKADDGRVVFNNSAERSTEELHGTPGAFGYSARIPMTGWAPGLYVMTIEAKSRLGNSPPVSRAIQFNVR